MGSRQREQPEHMWRWGATEYIQESLSVSVSWDVASEIGTCW